MTAKDWFEAGYKIYEILEEIEETPVELADTVSLIIESIITCLELYKTRIEETKDDYETARQIEEER